MCDFSRFGTPSEEWLAVQHMLPDIPKDFDIIELRKANNKAREVRAAREMEELSPLVTIQDYTIPTRDGKTVEGRSYRPKTASETELLPMYFHLHGGGFIFGTLSTEDAGCSRIALASQVVVFNVKYRHTPEHPYPTAWHDAQDTFQWVHSRIDDLYTDPSKIVVGGISAGACLAASLVLEHHLGRLATDCPPIAGQLLMIPTLVNMDCYGPQLAKIASAAVSSYVQNANAPMLTMDRARYFNNLLKVENPDEEDTVLNPGNAKAEQVKGLPPTVFGIAGMDLLRDEGLLYAKMLTEAGVPTDVNIFKGLPHAFRRFGEKLSDSKRWDDIMVNGIPWTLSNPRASQEFYIKTE